MALLDILKQYTAGATPTGETVAHFDTVAQQASPNALGSGIAAALRSDATPPFAQTIGHLFEQSPPEQKAGLLSEMMGALGSGGLSAAGSALLKGLAPAASPAGPAVITPAQAAQVSRSDATAIAASAEQQDASIVDRIGAFYSQHPGLVKTLGVAALGAVLSHMSRQQRSST